MKKIVSDLHIDIYASRIFDMYFKGKKLAVFDIETTGLSPACCKVILSGIMLIEKDSCRAIQLFADRDEDEKEILRHTLDILSSADVLLTYNGRHFDLPFVEARAKRHGLKDFRLPYNLDLYLVVYGHSPLRQMLPSLKQKSLESYMGLSSGRSDKISGGESVELYDRYMRTHAFDLEQKILLHNYDDILQLYKLLPVIEKTDFHRAMFKLGFPAGSLQIKQISLSGRDLHVSALQGSLPQDYISFPTADRPYSLLMNKAEASLELTIPCEVQSGALYFDAQALLGQRISEIEKYPSVTNGYLIVSDNGNIHHMEINAFLLAFSSALASRLD